MLVLSRKSFNGADVFQRRRRCSDRCWNSPTTSLQWGRRLSTSETHSARHATPHHRPRFNGADVFQRRRRSHSSLVQPKPKHASMGPTSFNVGDGNGGDLTPRECCRLQWGRRLSTSETMPSAPGMPSAPALQWGRRLSTSETWFDREASRKRQDRFNGADVFQRRRPLIHRSPNRPVRLASMGPTSFNVGDVPGGIGTGTVFRASMGPTSFNVGDLDLEIQYHPS